MADQRSPGQHLKTILMSAVIVVALAAGLVILYFGLTRMLGIRKHPDRTATFSVREAPRYIGVLPIRSDKPQDLRLLHRVFIVTE